MNEYVGSQCALASNWIVCYMPMCGHRLMCLWLCRLSQSEPTGEPAFLDKYSVESAVALCDVIVAILNGTARSADDAPFLGKKPHLSINWHKVCDMIKATTGLRTPLECQRLWKYIAYGKDVGELAVLAPDSDDEDVVSASKPVAAAVSASAPAAAPSS